MKSHLKAILLVSVFISFAIKWPEAMNALFDTNIEWFWGLPVGAAVAWAVWDVCFKEKKDA